MKLLEKRMTRDQLEELVTRKGWDIASLAYVLASHKLFLEVMDNDDIIAVWTADTPVKSNYNSYLSKAVEISKIDDKLEMTPIEINTQFREKCLVVTKD